MPELAKNLYLVKNYKIFFILLGIAFISGIISLFWQFWLIFGIILYIILVIYFSKELKDLLNIHVVALSLIVFYALPSTIFILLGQI